MKLTGLAQSLEYEMTNVWAKIPVKVREQIVRAGRLFGVTFVAQFLAAGEPVSWKAVCALIVAAGETVFRVVVPVTPDKPPVPVPAPVSPVQPLPGGQAGVLRQGALLTILIVLAIIAVLVFLILHLSVHPH
jgi:hypothetical protein